MLLRVFLSAKTFFSMAAGIFLNASLVGANTVNADAELSESTRPACLTAVTNVDSSGLPEAAVATGTIAMAWKLPLFDASVGTAAQPAPKFTVVSMAGADDMVGAALVIVVAGAAAVV